MARTRVRVVIRPGFERDLRRSREVLEQVDRAASAGVEVAKGIAPAATGAYRDGIELDSAAARGELPARIVATDHKSNWVEFGTGAPGPTPKFRVLGRTADSIPGRKA